MNFEIKDKEKYKDNDFEIGKRWQERLKMNNNNPKKCMELMRRANPLVIPRNHKVEEVLDEANNNNVKPLNKLLDILDKPYSEQKDIINFQVPSSNEKYKTFCGT